MSADDSVSTGKMANADRRVDSQDIVSDGAALRRRSRRYRRDVAIGGARAIRLSAIIRNRRALLGATLTAIVVLMGLLSIVWTPFDPNEFDSTASFQSPSFRHLMGTDIYGRDIFSRMMAGAQVSLLVAAAAVAGATICGTVLGVAAGYFAGAVDAVLTRIIDLMLAIPGLVLAVGVVTLLGPSASSVAIALIGVYSWQFARLVRSAVVSARSRPYVEAARGLDVGTWSLMVKDIFPSVLPILIVQITTAFAWGVLDEASIGFLGLGVQPPNPSWGSLLIEGRQYMYQAPWLAIGAGAVVAISVLGINFLGDGLRDIVDPRSKGKTA